LNLRTFVARHWKAIVIILQIGLVALSLAAAKAHADPINTPIGP
jgi:type IV secretory pathway TrbD component